MVGAAGTSANTDDVNSCAGSANLTGQLADVDPQECEEASERPAQIVAAFNRVAALQGAPVAARDGVTGLRAGGCHGRRGEGADDDD